MRMFLNSFFLFLIYLKTEDEDDNLDVPIIVVLLGLPYVVDFTSGVFTFLMAISIFDHEGKKEKEEREKVSN